MASNHNNTNLPARPSRRFPRGVLFAAALLAAAGIPVRQSVQAGIEDFAEFSLEQLMNITVTSVAKREQRLSDAPAAIFVLTGEEIRRSGATSIPDALRLVPGMHVASVNANSWAVSSRGFNDLYANKLLVLVDGRAVYSPLYAGVFWDLQRPVPEDLDRIEVIRGPGATLWGANAVNGVINIVTRDAKETQGLAVSAGGGDVHEVMNHVRYGGQAGENTYYRVFSGYRSTADFPLRNGDPAGDRWQAWHGGFRLDSRPDPDTRLTWQSDATFIDYQDKASSAHNFNTLGRLRRDLLDGSDFEVQAYHDQIHRDDDAAGRITIDTFDLSTQHGFDAGDRNRVLWGLGYRLSTVEVQGGPAIEPRDGNMDIHLFSGFVQNELTVIPDELILTAGTKVEHNSFTGLELQPGLRGLFRPTERQAVWAAVSRAVRTPSVAEGSNTYAFVFDEFQDPLAGPIIPMFAGNPDLKSEVLWAWEMGYRTQPSDRVVFDLSTFYNHYDRLVQVHFEEGDFEFGIPASTLEFPYRNALKGSTYGGEAVVTIAPVDEWRLSLAYSLLWAHLRGPEGTNPWYNADSSPRNMLTLRSSLDITPETLVDAQLRYVDNTAFAPSYLTADFRLAYRPNDRIELSVAGQNLFQPQHTQRDFDFIGTVAETPRSFYGKVTWGF